MIDCGQRDPGRACCDPNLSQQSRRDDQDVHDGKAQFAPERVRLVIEAADIALPSGKHLRVTVSFGCAGRANAASNCNFDDLVKRADLALYAAKASARNCVVASPIVPSAAPQEERRKAAGGTHDFHIRKTPHSHAAPYHFPTGRLFNCRRSAGRYRRLPADRPSRRSSPGWRRSSVRPAGNRRRPASHGP